MAQKSVDHPRYLGMLESPAGTMRVVTTDTHVVEVSFIREGIPELPDAITRGPLPDLLYRTQVQLAEYFAGDRREFNLAMAPSGTEFQQRTWKELLKIPYGSTISYLELAKRLGDLKTIRAAASANGKNPLAILIPCHRVIGSNGELTGYAGGITRKKYLLEWEGRRAGGKLTLF